MSWPFSRKHFYHYISREQVTLHQIIIDLNQQMPERPHFFPAEFPQCVWVPGLLATHPLPSLHPGQLCMPAHLLDATRSRLLQLGSFFQLPHAPLSAVQRHRHVVIQLLNLLALPVHKHR